MSHNTYLETEVMTASPGKLVVMLYDGAINFLKRLDGLDYLEHLEKKAYTINKAFAIISELQSTLDMNHKEIAEPLFSMYNYMQRRLMDANMNNDPLAVAEVMKLISELKEPWVQITSPQKNLISNNDEQVIAQAQPDPSKEDRPSFSMAG